MGAQKQPVPKNWPPGLPYLTQPSHSPSLSRSQLSSLRTRAPPPSSTSALREIPSSGTGPGPSPNARITPITDAQHPARGQAGLFACRPLAPGTLVLPYLGQVHPSDDPAHEGSDYDLRLDHEGDGGGVAIDAARMGNEARFVNDFRGVPGVARPNAEFCEVWDVRRGERGMAVFVLPAGKKDKGKKGGIAKGQEILVSYGKGFWGKRREEMEGDDPGEVQERWQDVHGG